MTRASAVAGWRRVLQAWADLRLPIKSLVVISIPMATLTIASVTFKLVDDARHESQHLRLEAERVREAAQAIAALVNEAELGVRGHLLTGRGEFLHAFTTARATLPHALDRLDDVLRQTDAARARMPLVRALTRERLQALEAVRRAHEAETVHGGSFTGRLLVTGRALEISLRHELTAIEAMQTARLAAHFAEMERLDRVVEVVVPTSVFGGLALALVAGFLLATGVVHRVQQLDDNAHRLANGQPLVPLPSAADEIGRLGQSLVDAAAVLDEQQRNWRAARDEADTANRAKSEFLSRMSHELRTPLNAVIGFGQVLEMSDLAPDQRDCTRQILKGGHHLLQLINEILEISRLERARLEVSPEPVRIDDIVVEAVDLVRPLAAERQLTFEHEQEAALYAIADRQRLKQVLLNLLSNAVKYNRESGAVRLEARRLDGRVRISVADTGRGIPEAQRSKLFLPFERLGAEASGIEGTGLGLTLSRGLVEKMGGTIGLESVEGEGSTFWVDLQPAESPSAALHAFPARIVAGGAPDRTRVVLHIEDNLASVALVEQLFARDHGVRLLAAMQGRLGLELAIEHQPDLVLVDLNLPDIHGLDLLQRLREHPRTRAIPVVVVSADATPGQIDRAMRLGATGYLPKPIDVGAFLRAVGERLAAA